MVNTGQLRSKKQEANEESCLTPPCPESQANNPESVLDINGLSVLEIKQKLKELGVKTRARKLEKLQEILKRALEDQ